jgi:hypothetical protein
MKTRTIGVLSIITLVLTSVWVLLLITGIVLRGTVDTFEQAVTYSANPDWTFFATYLNAVLLTLGVTALFAGWYVHLRSKAPASAMFGLVFIPIYSVLNLFSYLSQITLLPRLQAFLRIPEYQAITRLLLAMLAQPWSGSAVYVMNNLAYSVLAIPSILYGLEFAKAKGTWRSAGILLIISGAACIVAMIGIITGIQILAIGSLIGGAFFLAALVPLSVAFLRLAQYHDGRRPRSLISD